MENSFLFLLSFQLLFLLAISFTSPTYANYTDFLLCLSDQFQNSPSQVIYTPENSSYLSILQFSGQNQRFVSSQTPKPLAIITPLNESHVQNALYCCRKHGIQIRVRSGGHDFEGLSYVSKVPFAIIDLLNLGSVKVNVKQKTVWVQAGATLGALYFGIANKSSTLAFPAGSCPTIGAGGHFSGGGYGMMVRAFGLAADHVIDAVLVDTNGQVLDRKAMGENLFWAIRGGGASSFGIILAWKVKLVNVPKTVTVFRVGKTLEENAIQLVHRWQFIADKMDKRITLRIVLANVNSSDDGQRTILASFTAIFLGGLDSLIPLMEKEFPELGLVKENCQEISWIESIRYFYQDGTPLNGLLNRTYAFKFMAKVKSDFVKQPIPENVIGGLSKMFQEEEPNVPLMVMTPFGGRMSEIPSSEIPFPHRAGNLYLIEYQVSWLGGGEETSERNFRWIRRLSDYLAPYVSRRPRAAYLNYRDLDIGVNNVDGNTSFEQARIWGKKYFLGNFKRLAYVKSLVDPENFFRNEQSIPLAEEMYN